MTAIPRYASAGGGALLASATGALASVRRAAKPLHPDGEVVAGRLHRRGAGAGAPRTGVPWLDEPGEDDVEVRRSRAIGLPSWLPDIHGLAVRVRAADVLVMELSGMKPQDERFTAKTMVLIENVRHHIEEEEQEWFPQVREALGRKTLQQVGAEMAEARDRAPRRPSQPSALKKTVDAVTS